MQRKNNFGFATGAPNFILIGGIVLVLLAIVVYFSLKKNSLPPPAQTPELSPAPPAPPPTPAPTPAPPPAPAHTTAPPPAPAPAPAPAPTSMSPAPTPAPPPAPAHTTPPTWGETWSDPDINSELQKKVYDTIMGYDFIVDTTIILAWNIHSKLGIKNIAFGLARVYMDDQNKYTSLIKPNVTDIKKELFKDNILTDKQKRWIEYNFV